jgi:hypothetical protein
MRLTINARELLWLVFSTVICQQRNGKLSVFLPARNRVISTVMRLTEN